MSESQSPPSSTEGYWVAPETLARLGDGSVEKGRAQLRLLLSDTRPRRVTGAPVRRPERVRLAGPADEPAILNLLLEDLEENATKVAPPSVPRLQAEIEVATRGKGGFLPVVEDGHGICALALIAPVPWWWSQTTFLQEVFLYVTPRARHTHAADDLLKFEKWLSRQMTIELGRTMHVLAGVTAPRRKEAKVRLYARHMQPIGAFFVYPQDRKSVV